MKALLHFFLVLAIGVQSGFSEMLEELLVDPGFELSFAGPFGYLDGSTTPPQPDPLAPGRFLAIGFFDRADGVPTTNIVRFTLDGHVDPSFRSALDGFPVFFEIAPNGALFVWVMKATSSSAGQENPIVRLLPNGSIDPTFNLNWEEILTPNNPSATSPGLDMQPLPDGRLLALFYTSTNTTALIRLNQDGSLDPSFQLDPTTPPLRAFHVQPSGHILAATQTHPATLVRFTSDGVLDPSYAPVELSSVFFLRNGSVLEIQDQTNSFSIRLRDVEGIIDPNFTQQVVPGLYVSAVEHSNGKFTLTTISLEPEPSVFGRRFTLSGIVDAEFPLPRDSTAGSWGIFPGDSGAGYLAALPNDELLFLPHGAFLYQSDRSHSSCIQLNSQGTIIGVISPALERVTAPLGTTPLPNGGALAFGGFTRVGNQPCHGLVRLRPDGAIDPDFQTPGLASLSGVRSVTFQPDGKLLLITGGHDYFVGNLGPGGIARLNPDGTKDRAFAFARADQSDIRSLHLQSDGKILVAGAFTNGTDVVGLMRLNQDGAIDPGFQPFPGEADWVGRGREGQVHLYTRALLYSVNSSGAAEALPFPSPPHQNTAFHAAWVLPNESLLFHLDFLMLSSRSSPTYYYSLDEIGFVHAKLSSLIQSSAGKFFGFGKITSSHNGFASNTGLVTLDENGQIETVHALLELIYPLQPIHVFSDNSFLGITRRQSPYGAVPVVRHFRLPNTKPPIITAVPNLGSILLEVSTESWKNTRIESSPDMINWTLFRTLSATNAIPALLPESGTTHFFRAVVENTP